LYLKYRRSLRSRALARGRWALGAFDISNAAYVPYRRSSTVWQKSHFAFGVCTRVRQDLGKNQKWDISRVYFYHLQNIKYSFPIIHFVFYIC